MKNFMHYSEVTQNNTWQCVATWQDLLDPTSETPCGQSELWMPPLGESDVSDLTDLVTESGVCLFVIIPECTEVTGLHRKYQSTDTVIWDGMLSLCGFKTVPDRYGIYYTP